MINKLFLLREDFINQLESYEKHPITGSFDKGYRSGVKHCLIMLCKLDKKLINDKVREQVGGLD